MGTILSEKTTDTFDRTAVLDPARRARRPRRLGYVAGAVGAAAAGATILVTSVLPASAPQLARMARLPGMSNSVGFWDVASSREQVTLPSMPAGMGYWDANSPNDPRDFVASPAASGR
jgi:hypothetical protein